MSDNALVADTAAGVVRRIGIKLAALAQDGLTFAAGAYDLDRYRQVSQLAAELLAAISGRPAADLLSLLLAATALVGLGGRAGAGPASPFVLRSPRIADGGGRRSSSPGSDLNLPGRAEALLSTRPSAAMT